jgi:ABC-type cobalamin/Fe3+-siderophores transport system ATPase subunit
LQVTVGKRLLLLDVNEQWPAGSLVVLLGPNGLGKTTLLDHISGIKIKGPGQVFWGNEDVSLLSPLNRAERIASIAQHDEAPLETLVYDRIAHGLYARRMSGNLSASDEKNLVSQVAEAIGIAAFLNRPLFRLSGGQRKKVHIARALVDDRAAVYLLDEPDANLDPQSRDHIMQVLKLIASRRKVVVVSLHHHELANAHASAKVDISKYRAPQV